MKNVQMQSYFWSVFSCIRTENRDLLNDEVEEFMSRWSQSLINVRSPSYLKQKTFDYCLCVKILHSRFFIRTC